MFDIFSFTKADSLLNLNKRDLNTIMALFTDDGLLGHLQKMSKVDNDKR